MEFNFTIYVLIDPETREIRYVGITRHALSNRLSQHVNEAKKTNKHGHRNHWIRSLLSKGLRPEIAAIEVVPECERESKEKYWIAKLRETCNLVNDTEDGEGLINPSQDVRMRIAESVKRNGFKGGRAMPHSKEGRANIKSGMMNSTKFKESMKNRRKPEYTTEYRKSLASNLGKKFSTEHKAKISEARKKYWADLNATIALQCGI